jgi:hypothetical protein
MAAFTEHPETDKDGTTRIFYKVSGIPAGAVTIGKSPDGLTALRYAHFKETEDGYVFWEKPTRYGVVSSRGGDHCTFCVCVGKPLYLEDQDYNKQYCSALDDMTVSRFAESCVELPLVNGLSGTLLALACGATTAPAAGVPTEEWSEGSDRYCIVNDKLLVSRGRAGDSINKTLEEGDTMTPILADFIVYANQSTHEAVWMDSDTQPSKLPDFLKTSIPAAQHVADLDVLRSAIEAAGQYTYDTTNSPDDVGTQKLLRAYRTTAPYIHLTQKLEINTTADIDKLSTIAVIYTDTKNTKETREAEESALSYMLRCGRTGAISVILKNQIHKQGDFVYATNIYAINPTRTPAVGMYIQSIVLLGPATNNKFGAILDEVKVKPTTVKSGESIAIKITKI